MEQFFFVPASVYNNNNKNLKSRAVTKQELPKYQADQFLTYQIDSLKKEINKKLLVKADSLVDKILSCPLIRLSKLQTLILDGAEAGASLSDFAEKLRRKNADVPDIYSTLLDAVGISPTLVLNQMPKPKRGKAGPFSTNARQKLQKLYTQGAAAYGSVRNLVKASNLPVSKVRQLLH